MPDICLDLQDVITSVALPPCFTSSKISTLLWIIGMVVSCCDATSNVLITSFWSHCQAHPCILWRSKLRNTYCTLNFAKYCFRILSWNARLNVSIFFRGGRSTSWQPSVCCQLAHTQIFWMPLRLINYYSVSFWNDQIDGAGIRSHPHIILCLMRRSGHVCPVSLVLLYIACQYINGCFSPSYWRKRVEGKGG